MNGTRPAEAQDGSTVPELLVAATIVIIALSMVAGNLLPGLRALERAAGPDLRAAELATASEIVARAVRSARPGVDRPSVTGDDRHLVIGLAPGGTLLLRLEEGVLRAESDGDVASMSWTPPKVIVEGLDMAVSGFAFLDADGRTVDPDASVLGVRVTLADGEHRETRVIALRMRTHLHGVEPW